MNSRRRPALGGDIDHPNARRINLQRMNGKKMNLKEPMKDEPTPPKSSPQTKQVWKEKVTSPYETPSQDVQPSGSPWLRPDDAPEK